MSKGFRSAVDAALSDDTAPGGAMEQWMSPTTESRVEQIPVDAIGDPDWRRPVDTSDPSFRALKASVRASGILQPLLVRPREGGGFEVVSGMRRLQAARVTAQVTVPALIRELGDLESIVGSWDAIRRSPVDETMREGLRSRLLFAGMSGPEAEALIATLPVAGGGAAVPPPMAAASVRTPEPAVAVAEAPLAAPAVEPAAPLVETPVTAAPAVEPPDVEPPAVEPPAEAPAPAAPVEEPAVEEPAVQELAEAAPEVEAVAPEVPVVEDLAPEVAGSAAGEPATAAAEPLTAGPAAGGPATVEPFAAEAPIDAPPLHVPALDEVAVAPSAAVAEDDVAPAWTHDELVAQADEREAATRAGEPPTPEPEAAPATEPAPAVAGTPWPQVEAPAIAGWPAVGLLPAVALAPPAPDADTSADEAGVAEPAPAAAEPDATAAHLEEVAPDVAELEQPVVGPQLTEPAAADLVTHPAAGGMPPPVTGEPPVVVEAPASDAEITVPAAAPVGPSPRVIAIAVPGDAPGANDGAAAGVIVVAPGGHVAPEVPALPAEPVTGVAADGTGPRRGLGSRIVRDPRTYATIGTFIAVWAIVFDLVAIALGVTNTRLLLGGAVAAIIGFVTAIASLAVPSRSP